MSKFTFQNFISSTESFHFQDKIFISTTKSMSTTLYIVSSLFALIKAQALKLKQWFRVLHSIRKKPLAEESWSSKKSKIQTNFNLLSVSVNRRSSTNPPNYVASPELRSPSSSLLRPTKSSRLVILLSTPSSTGTSQKQKNQRRILR